MFPLMFHSKIEFFWVHFQGIIQKKYGRIGFMQNKKTDLPKARKMAAGGLGSAVRPAR